MIELVTLCYTCELAGRNTEAIVRRSGGSICPQCDAHLNVANLQYDINQMTVYGHHIPQDMFDRLVHLKEVIKNMPQRLTLDIK